MSDKEKEVAKTAGKEVATADFMEDLAGQGYEHMTAEDFVQAFVVILQPLSPQCVKGKDEYMEEAEPGMFYNRATGKLYGKDIQVIPIYYLHEWTEWKPNRGGFCGKHEPHSISVDTSDYAEWKTREGNIINDTYTFYCFLPEHPEDGLVLMSFTSTNIKPAKSWNSMINMVRTPKGAQAPFFSSVWKLAISKREANNNTWYTIGVAKANAERLRYISGEEYKTMIEPLIELARNTNVAYAKSGQEEGDAIEGTVEANVDY